jgi:hypothetical protein
VSKAEARNHEPHTAAPKYQTDYFSTNTHPEPTQTCPTSQQGGSKESRAAVLVRDSVGHTRAHTHTYIQTHRHRHTDTQIHAHQVSKAEARCRHTSGGGKV